jgi:hypothetical protein
MTKSSLLIPETPGVALTTHGLKIQRLLSWEEWRELLSQTRRVKTTYLSILADITEYGRRNFGDDSVNQALEQLEFEMVDATKSDTIALVGYDRREKYGLTSEHAYVLGHQLEAEEEWDKWAGLTLKHNLTAFELKKSIEKGEVIRHAEITEKSGHGTGIPSVQAIRYQFERWQRQFPDRTALLKLPTTERQKILDLLSPIVELAASIETSIHPKTKSK